jgi:hypothetical protein
MHGMKLHGVTTAIPTHDGLEFKESGMMVVSVVYKLTLGVQVYPKIRVE